MKIRKRLIEFALAATLAVLAFGHDANAGVIVTSGAGSAVTSPDAVANFNTLTNGSSLTSYSEDGLSVTIPALDFVNFDPTAGNGDSDGAFLLGDSNGGFFYANGQTDPVDIQLVGGGDMSGAEFDVGNGFGTMQTYLAYLTNDGSGVATVSSGSIIGFSDPGGFSFLEVAAYGSLATAEAELSDNLAGPDGNGIAIDNLREQNAAAATPEPGTAFLLTAALGSWLLSRRARRLVGSHLRRIFV